MLSLAAGFLGGFVFNELGVPVPWLLGSMGAVLTLNLLVGRARPVQRPALLMAQGALGTSVGLTLNTQSLSTLMGLGWVTLVAIVLTMAYGVLNGLLLYRLSSLDFATAMLSSIPGGASEITVLSDDMGADVRVVATLHSARVILVVTVVPILITAMVRGVQGLPAASTAAVVPQAAFGFRDWALVLLIILGSYGLTRRFHVPAGALILSMILAGALHLAGVVAGPAPTLLRVAAQVVLGTAIGSRFDREGLGKVIQVGAAGVLMILLTVLGGVTVGYLFAVWGGLHLPAALLSMAPGGASEMAMTAVALGENASIVTTVQLIRLLISFMVVPRLLQRLFARHWTVLEPEGRLSTSTKSI